MDKESELEVQKSINDLQLQRTSITVAHRLNTIVNSDIILVVEDGKIVEQGSIFIKEKLNKEIEDNKT